MFSDFVLSLERVMHTGKLSIQNSALYGTRHSTLRTQSFASENVCEAESPTRTGTLQGHRGLPRCFPISELIFCIQKCMRSTSTLGRKSIEY